MKPMMLIAMRAVDMNKVHPEMIFRDCHRCKTVVGIYPSGQGFLIEFPDLEVVCQVCAGSTEPPDLTLLPISALRESTESIDITKKKPN